MIIFCSGCSGGEWIPVGLLPAVLTFFVFSCPVLPCSSYPWLPRPIYNSHTETCQPDILNYRGRCLPALSVSVCLCPLLSPAFGYVKPLLFFLPFSLAAPGAASLLFIHPKHCWGTPACVGMQRNRGISHCASIFLQHPWIPALHACPLFSCHLLVCVCLVLPAVSKCFIFFSAIPVFVCIFCCHLVVAF